MIAILGLLAYMVIGYLVYVPSAVKVKTERLIIAWDEQAQRDADTRRHDVRMATSHSWMFSMPRSEMSEKEAERYAQRRQRERDWEKEQIDAIRPAPAPVVKLRRQAARLWPLWCLTWLPLLAAGWSVLAFNATTNHAASLAPRTVREIEADNARLTARLAALEAEDKAWREANPS